MPWLKGRKMHASSGEREMEDEGMTGLVHERWRGGESEPEKSLRETFSLQSKCKAGRPPRVAVQTLTGIGAVLT
jgi:hypothetical protein